MQFTPKGDWHESDTPVTYDQFLSVMRFAPAARVRIAGYYWPEAAARLGGSPYLWTERAGRGRVIMFAHDPVYRDQQRGTLAIFANAVLLGGSY